MPDVAPAVAPAAAPAPNAAANGTPPAAKAAPEESWDFNEDGKTVKLTKSEAQKRFAEAAYAKKRLQQAADDAKAARAEAQKAKEEREADAKLRNENKREWLKKHEIDHDTFLREGLEEKLREQEMTPEQKRAESEKKRADDLQKKVEAHDAEARQAQVDATAKNITSWMVDGLDRAAKAAGLGIGPREFHVVHSVATEFNHAGVPLDSEWHNRVISEAKERIESAYGRLESAVNAGLTGEALAKRLGPRVVDELMKYKLELVRGKKTFGAGKPAIEQPPVAKPSKYIGLREAEEQLRKASKL